MNLKVRLYAVLRERAGASELAIDDLPDELSIGELKQYLKGQGVMVRA